MLESVSEFLGFSANEIVDAISDEKIEFSAHEEQTKLFSQIIR